MATRSQHDAQAERQRRDHRRAQWPRGHRWQATAIRVGHSMARSCGRNMSSAVMTFV